MKFSRQEKVLDDSEVTFVLSCSFILKRLDIKFLSLNLSTYVNIQSLKVQCSAFLGALNRELNDVKHITSIFRFDRNFALTLKRFGEDAVVFDVSCWLDSWVDCSLWLAVLDGCECAYIYVSTDLFCSTQLNQTYQSVTPDPPQSPCRRVAGQPSTGPLEHRGGTS